MIAVVHYSYIIAVKSVNNHRHRFSAPVNMVYTSEKMKRLNSVKNCDPICIPSSPLDKSSQSGRSLVVSRANPSHCCFCNTRHASIACPSLDPVSGGYGTSTFYKWMPLAEVKIIDAEIYCSLEESIPNMVDLLKRCQDFLAEHILTATTMRKNGDILK